jgi:hypothetical protein
MSWMGEIAIMIEEAASVGVTLEVGDFRRLGNRLMIDGMDADDWFGAVIRDVDRLEDLEV